MDFSHPEILEAVRRALAEDLGDPAGLGDVTTNLCVPAEARSTGRMFARQALTLAGIETLPLIFTGCEVRLLHASGARLADGVEIAVRVRSTRAPKPAILRFGAEGSSIELAEQRGKVRIHGVSFMN